MSEKRWVSKSCGNPAVYALERLAKHLPEDAVLLAEVRTIDEYMAERFADYERRIKELWDEKNVSLRDRFAAGVRAALEASEDLSFGPGNYHAGAAEFAYEAADAMLKERAK